MLNRGIDTLMLACTHYPLLIPVLKDFLPDGVRLVDSATTCAEHVRSQLTELDLLAEKSTPGSLQINLTDLSDQFEDLARRFLARSPGRIQRVSL
jgi:glutamate racemase